MWKYNIIKDWDSVWKTGHLKEWERLLHESPTSHVFFHPTLVKIWIDTYMSLRDLTPIFMWAKDDMDNVAFLPLVLWKRNWKGAFLHSIIPVGYSDYDYHDPLFKDIPSMESLSAFWKGVLEALEVYSCDEILLTGFRDRCIATDGRWEKGEICPYLDLAEITTEESLMSFFDTKLRGDIRRQIRRLNELGKLRFVEYDSAKDIPVGLFEQFIDAHSMKWSNAYKAPNFHRLLVESCGEGMPVHFSVMMLGNTPIAWHLGFEYQGIYYYYMPAGNPEYQKFSPVKIHLYCLITRAIERGYRRYDHLRGDETYKSGWSNGCQYVNDRAVIDGGISSKIKHGLIKLKALLG